MSYQEQPPVVRNAGSPRGPGLEKPVRVSERLSLVVLTLGTVLVIVAIILLLV